MTPNAYPTNAAFRLLDDLLKQVSIKAFAYLPQQDPDLKHSTWVQIQRANIAANRSRTALDHLRRRLTPPPTPPTNMWTTKPSTWTWVHHDTPKPQPDFSYTNRAALIKAANYWLKPPKHKTIRQTSYRPQRRTTTVYVLDIGWLTAREAEWYDHDDINIHSYMDGIGVSVDHRFDRGAQFTSPDPGPPQPQWALNGRAIPPKLTPWVDYD